MLLLRHLDRIDYIYEEASARPVASPNDSEKTFLGTKLIPTSQAHKATWSNLFYSAVNWARRNTPTFTRQTTLGLNSVFWKLLFCFSILSPCLEYKLRFSHSGYDTGCSSVCQGQRINQLSYILNPDNGNEFSKNTWRCSFGSFSFFRIMILCVQG